MVVAIFGSQSRHVDLRFAEQFVSRLGILHVVQPGSGVLSELDKGKRRIGSIEVAVALLGVHG